MKTYILLLAALCSSCRFDTEGFNGLVGGEWSATATCGSEELALEEDAPSAVGDWTCTAEPPVSRADGADLAITCEQDGTTLSLATLCVAGSPVVQWSHLKLPGDCMVVLTCVADETGVQ